MYIEHFLVNIQTERNIKPCNSGVFILHEKHLIFS